MKTQYVYFLFTNSLQRGISTLSVEFRGPKIGLQNGIRINLTKYKNANISGWGGGRGGRGAIPPDPPSDSCTHRSMSPLPNVKSCMIPAKKSYPTCNFKKKLHVYTYKLVILSYYMGKRPPLYKHPPPNLNAANQIAGKHNTLTGTRSC